MSDAQNSRRKLQSDFVISPGTQVVAKVAKALPGDLLRKPLPDDVFHFLALQSFVSEEIVDDRGQRCPVIVPIE
jgi:hypothetical protein